MFKSMIIIAVAFQANLALADYGTPTPTPVIVEPKVELTTVSVNDEANTYWLILRVIHFTFSI